MNVMSVCSGIGAPECAWSPLGWQFVACSEIEAFPSAVLAHHYPDVPNRGDMTRFEEWPDADVDVLVGGTPCQSFSVAGLRNGLADPRGNLALTYLAVADRYRPRWLVWENVPGVLSSNGGRDFGAFLGGLGQLGYGWAYRVLDAQYFGVAQRRKRVFVVGSPRGWSSAAAVLFERESLSGHPAPRREAGQAVARPIAAGSPRGSGYRNDADTADNLIPDVAHCLNAKGGGGRIDGESETFVAAYAPALSASNPYGDHESREGLLVAHSLRGEGGRPEGAVAGHVMPAAHGVRRLLPVECERLQGFPEIKNSAIIRVWSTEHQKNFALAGTLNHKSQTSALNADASASSFSASAAAQGSSASLLELGKHAAVHVLIDLERGALQIRSLNGSSWSASTAESASSSPLPMPIGAFARLLAHMPRIPALETSSGKAGSPPTNELFSHRLSGSALVHLCGQEIAALAKDADRFTTAADLCMRSTTSGAGSNSPAFASIWETWSCCVATAISGFIPEQTLSASSFDICVETVCGYTNIVYRGKPAADGPRYKALGNSMAVPVVRWIGERIQLVDDLIREINASEAA